MAFELEPNLEDGREEESSLKMFCNRETVCMRLRGYIQNRNNPRYTRSFWNLV